MKKPSKRVLSLVLLIVGATIVVALPSIISNIFSGIIHHVALPENLNVTVQAPETVTLGTPSL